MTTHFHPHLELHHHLRLGFSSGLRDHHPADHKPGAIPTPDVAQGANLILEGGGLHVGQPRPCDAGAACGRQAAVAPPPAPVPAPPAGQGSEFAQLPDTPPDCECTPAQPARASSKLQGCLHTLVQMLTCPAVEGLVSDVGADASILCVFEVTYTVERWHGRPAAASGDMLGMTLQRSACWRLWPGTHPAPFQSWTASCLRSLAAQSDRTAGWCLAAWSSQAR